jgi:hypothetical protein
VLPGGAVDLRARVLVAGVVPAPRFGRENEVVATARAVAARGADLVDVPPGGRLLGPAAGAVDVPVAVRVPGVDAAVAAGRAGAAVALVPPGAVAAAEADGVASPGVAMVLVVDDLAELAATLAAGERVGLPVAFDSTRLAAPDALAAEAVAITDGCRVLRTTDVRRSRRVAEVLGAVMAAGGAPGAPSVETSTGGAGRG